MLTHKCIFPENEYNADYAQCRTSTSKPNSNRPVDEWNFALLPATTPDCRVQRSTDTDNLASMERTVHIAAKFSKGWHCYYWGDCRHRARSPLPLRGH
jgi:hypothetical protein